MPDGTNKDIQTFKTGIPGLTGFNNPLDLIEDTRNGNLYVSEFGANQITLLKPIQGPVSGNNLKASPTRIYTDDDVNTTAGKMYTITVTNTGSSTITGLQASLSGANANQFALDLAGFTTNLNPGQSTTFKVSFNASAVGPQRANIIVSDQNSQNVNQVSLNGLGEAAGKEPSLQWIVDTHLGSGLVNVGDDDPSTDNINSTNPTASLLGSEIAAPIFRKAEINQPVTMQVLGVYAPTTVNPITEFGWYESNNSGVRTPVFTVDNTHDRTIDVKITGNDDFDPEDKVFGLYSRWPVFSNRLVFTQDELNTFDPATNHHVRIYPVPGQANTYILAVEEFVGAYDFQDIVVLLRNVKPVNGGVISLENMIKIPGTNIGFPDDDYYAFSRVGAPSLGMRFHDENTVRIHNKSNTPLTVNQISISNPSLFTLPNKDALPFVIGANQFYDLKVKYIDSSGVRGVKNAILQITSTAENKPVIEATLSGGYTVAPQGGNELGPQMTIDIFGFKTDTKTSTIQGLPNSAYPLPAEVDAGLHGDIIVSEYFVQANPAEPVVHFRLADYGGISSYNSRLINASGGVVGGVNFSNASEWYNSILPRSGITPNNPIAGVAAPVINVPFRIQLAEYTTSGRNGMNPATGFPRDLGVRVYPLKDRNGKIKPYQYIIIQDFIGGGCLGTDGEASCDWDDIIDVIINVKPQANPTATQVVNFSVEPGKAFTYNMAQHFKPGYSGNRLIYEAGLSNGNALPTWISINPATGEMQGNAPNTPEVTVEMKIIATDLNGIQVESVLRIKIGVTIVNPCTASGELLYEIWNNITGSSVSNLTSNANYPNNPSASQKLTGLVEGQNNIGDNYGSRISGILCAPETGSYTFWIAGDDNSELWLSTDINPANARRIASVPSWTNPREWSKFPEQQSAAISLEAGEKYYLFVLHKEGGGLDNIAIGWQLPDGTQERPMATTYFSLPEVVVPNPCTASGELLYEIWNNISGGSVSNLTANANYPNNPSSSQKMTGLVEGQINTADNYGSRISGILCAPQTGNYTFWISGDDHSELWLSTDQNPANAQKIASVPGWTNSREWSKYPEQQSAAISLKAGEKYYLYVLHKEGTGWDNIAIGWQLPNGTQERPMPTTYFSLPEIISTPNLGIFTDKGDIGTVGIAGSAVHSNGTYTLQGAGADIWGTADGFQFIHRTHNGDGEIIARVNSVQLSNEWAKAGIMFRESTAANSKMAMVLQRPDNQVTFQWRTETGSNAVWSGSLVGGTSSVKFLRLQRIGSEFRAFYSTNSQTGPWTQIGNVVNINMTKDVKVGLALTSHVTGVLSTAIFDQVSISNQVVLPAPPPIGEVGLAQVNQNWVKINLKNTYTNPVVVTGDPSYNDPAQTTVRVRNITPNSFEVRIQEWDCLDGTHATESVPYIVIEQGAHVLPNGKTLQAGKITANSSWANYNFPQAFVEVPTILTQITSVNEASAANTRLNHSNTTVNQFRLLLQEQEGSGTHANEEVCWIAIEPGIQSSDFIFEAAVASRVADEVKRRFNFKQSYTTPVFVGKISSYLGGDPISLRFNQNNINGTSVEVLGEEESCGDSEVSHALEDVHYLVFNGTGDIRALSTTIPTPVVSAFSHWKMDNNATDAIGSNNGTTQNGANFSTNKQIGTHALNLDGTNDYVSVPSSPSLNVNANFSFSLWINPSSTSGRRGILAKLTNSSHKQYALSLENGTIQFDYEKDANNWVLKGGNVSANQWTFVVLTVDATGNVNIYLNGTLSASAKAPTLTNLGDQPLEFGRWGGSYNDSYFGGRMDDIKFYNRALNATEVASLSTAGRPSVKVAGIESQASQEELQINLYPNPVNQEGKMNIQLTAPQGENVGIKIFNAQGMAVLDGFEVTMDRETKEISLKVSNLKPGVYFVVTSHGGKTLYKRFIVTQE
ncbi:MAG: LamG-like jellyroll fold domain-containing protein [Microscillaceae bacterium]|nr:LamG-like jellyroll fold domain-containing protein [Microscillaceae bacterium]